MVINGFTKGVLVGLGVGAAAFYLYKSNEGKVDDFLRKQGVPVKKSESKDYSKMSVEELMEMKEDIEDIIAEREVSGEDEVIVCEPEAAVEA